MDNTSNLNQHSQDEVCAALKTALHTGELPHLLFYGPPGTGKTSTILAVCRELYGPLMKKRVLELNASDERGIKVVRDKIKKFAQTKVGKNKVDGFPCPPFKIIILDEADAMTDVAQAALRRTIEQYSKVTRFCLICNYVSRIIDPLASRCAKFRFKPLSNSAMLGRLREVAAAENLTLVDDCEDTLIKTSQGDMRKGKRLQNNISLISIRKRVLIYNSKLVFFFVQMSFFFLFPCITSFLIFLLFTLFLFFKCVCIYNDS